MKKPLKVFVVLTVLVSLSVLVVGQFKKLGSHRPPSKGATILGGKFPPPAVLYYHFIERDQPLLMKNVLNETGYTAFEKWTDEYLRAKYGNERVDVERGKKEDRDGKSVQLHLSKFLDIYKDSNLYMVHTVPDSMKEEVLVPYSLHCGGFQDNLQDAVIWFSSGETKSVLHLDTVDNINCLLDGEKQLVLIDKRYKDKIEEYGWVEDGAYSEVDVDAVDPGLFPGIYNADWFQINMQKGDCVYIPYRWYHHVYSPPGRNLAINLWFSHLWWFNQTDCKDQTSKESKPLSEFTIASPNMQLKSEFLSRFEKSQGVSEKSFVLSCGCESEQDALQLWELLNKDKDRKLTWEELYRFDIEEMVKKFPQCFNMDEMDDDVEEAEENNESPVNSETVDDVKESLHSSESLDEAVKDKVDDIPVLKVEYKPKSADKMKEKDDLKSDIEEEEISEIDQDFDSDEKSRKTIHVNVEYGHKSSDKIGKNEDFELDIDEEEISEIDDDFDDNEESAVDSEKDQDIDQEYEKHRSHDEF